LQTCGIGSIRASSSTAEQWTLNPQVSGSNPEGRTKQAHETRTRLGLSKVATPPWSSNAANNAAKGSDKCGRKLPLICNFIGWGYRKYVHELCAVVEDLAKSNGNDCRAGRYLYFTESESQPPEMDCAVFVPVEEIVEVDQGEVKWLTPIRVRLQGLDECPWAIADGLDARRPLRVNSPGSTNTGNIVCSCSTRVWSSASWKTHWSSADRRL
jgi:hypothetical protein